MKVLLVNPNREHMPWPAVPIGLCTVATALHRAGHQVRVLDLTFSQNLAGELREGLRSFAPDVVGLTVRNIDNCNFEAPHFYLSDVRDLVLPVIRETAPSARLVLGGSAVNIAPRSMLDFLEADYALLGEGELSMPRLVDALAGGGDLRGVPGLVQRRATEPLGPTNRLELVTPPSVVPARVVDADSFVPSQAWRWLDLRRYRDAQSPYPVQTKRGCMLECLYCVYGKIEGRAYRLRKPAHVADEIEEAVVNHGVRKFDFVDSTFNVPQAHARDICEALTSRRLPLELSTMGLNPAGLNAGMVADMKRAGFRAVMCTPESASDVTLRSLRKGFHRGDVERAAKVLREADLPTYWFFLFGAPGETMATALETLKFCEQHIPPTHVVLLSTGLRVYPGTPLEAQCKDSGWFEQHDPLFFPSWYVSPELELNELYAAVLKAAKRHPNWMINAETALDAKAAGAVKTALRLLRRKGPFWQHVPLIFSWASRFGARQKGFATHAERMRGVTKVSHRW